jgi:uncharacterized protein (UPF0218 family)
MGIAYQLSARLREKLKKPLGELICGSYRDTVERVKAIVEEEEPPCVVSVGDVVSKNLSEANIQLKLAIVDNKVMRAAIEPLKIAADVEKRIKNPPGTITFEALNAVKEAFETSRTVKIIVDGEEDLLALLAIQYAPENSIIVYGQPREGLVVVRANREKKAEIGKILGEMQFTAKD